MHLNQSAITDYIKSNDLISLRTFLDDDIETATCCETFWDYVPEIVACIACNENATRKDTADILLSYLSDLTPKLSCKEYILSLVGSLAIQSSLECLIFLLPILKKITLNVGLNDFCILKPMFEQVNNFIIKLIYETDKVESKAALGTLFNFLSDIFTKPRIDQIAIEAKSFYEEYFISIIAITNLKFLQSEVYDSYVYILIKTFCQISNLQSYMTNISLLSQLEYEHFASQSEINQIKQCKCLNAISVIHFIFRNRLDSKLAKIWPLVYTNKKYIDLTLPLSLKVFNFNPSHIESNVFLKDVLKYQFDLYENFSFSTIILLKSLFENTSDLSLKTNCLIEDLSKCLIKFITKPINSETIPKSASLSLETLEALLSAMTFTSQFLLLRKILNGQKDNMHHGFYGHCIRLTKDSLHRLWMKAKEDGISLLEKREAICKESPVRLLCKAPVLTVLFDIIFKIEKLKSVDTFMDDIVWISTALNLIIYIALRYDALNSKTFVDEEIISVLRRKDSHEKLLINTKFLEALESNIVVALDHYSRESLSTSKCEKSIAKVASENISLHMTRLRLVQNTLERVKKLLHE